jgi:hypothetical protein
LGEGAEAKSGRTLGKIDLTSPAGTLDAYLQAMAGHNSNPGLPIYSKASRRMMRERVITRAQMDNAVKSARDCTRQTEQQFSRADLAVIRYPAAARGCPPWMFVREGQEWHLDLASMNRLLGFGRKNQWHFHRSQLDDNEYEFAFQDWSLDRNGYPIIAR